MGILDYFKSHKIEKHTASKAKERLQIIVAHERANRPSADFLPKLKKELLAVIGKYVDINEEQVQVHLDTKDQQCPVLELNVLLSDKHH